MELDGLYVILTHAYHNMVHLVFFKSTFSGLFILECFLERTSFHVRISGDLVTPGMIFKITYNVRACEMRH